jgi:hypothetical protein
MWIDGKIFLYSLLIRAAAEGGCVGELQALLVALLKSPTFISCECLPV